MYKYIIMESGDNVFQNNDFKKLISDFILREYKNIRENFVEYEDTFYNYEILSELLSYLYKEVNNERDYFNQIYKVLKKWDIGYDIYNIELIIDKEV